MEKSRMTHSLFLDPPTHKKWFLIDLSSLAHLINFELTAFVWVASRTSVETFPCYSLGNIENQHFHPL